MVSGSHTAIDPKASKSGKGKTGSRSGGTHSSPQPGSSPYTSYLAGAARDPYGLPFGYGYADRVSSGSFLPGSDPWPPTTASSLSLADGRGMSPLYLRQGSDLDCASTTCTTRLLSPGNGVGRSSEVPMGLSMHCPLGLDYKDPSQLLNPFMTGLLPSPSSLLPTTIGHHPGQFPFPTLPPPPMLFYGHQLSPEFQIPITIHDWMRRTATAVAHTRNSSTSPILVASRNSGVQTITAPVVEAAIQTMPEPEPVQTTADSSCQTEFISDCQACAKRKREEEKEEQHEIPGITSGLDLLSFVALNSSPQVCDRAAQMDAALPKAPSCNIDTYREHISDDFSTDDEADHCHSLIHDEDVVSRYNAPSPSILQRPNYQHAPVKFKDITNKQPQLQEEQEMEQWTPREWDLFFQLVHCSQNIKTLKEKRAVLNKRDELRQSKRPVRSQRRLSVKNYSEAKETADASIKKELKRLPKQKKRSTSKKDKLEIGKNDLQTPGTEATTDTEIGSASVTSTIKKENVCKKLIFNSTGLSDMTQAKSTTDNNQTVPCVADSQETDVSSPVADGLRPGKASRSTGSIGSRSASSVAKHRTPKPTTNDWMTVRRSERIFLGDACGKGGRKTYALSSGSETPTPDITTKDGRETEYKLPVARKRSASKTDQDLKRQRSEPATVTKDSVCEDMISTDSDSSTTTTDSEEIPLQLLLKSSSLTSLVRPNTPEPISPVMTEAHLKQGQKILYCMQGLFFEGVVEETNPPDLYGLKLTKERCRRSHVLAREELLDSVVLDVPVLSGRFLRVGQRVCAYWSQQFSCLYPGVIVRDSPDPRVPTSKDFVNVEFDDGDSGCIPLMHVRLLPDAFPIQVYAQTSSCKRPRHSQSEELLADMRTERKPSVTNTYTGYSGQSKPGVEHQSTLHTYTGYGGQSKPGVEHQSTLQAPLKIKIERSESEPTDSGHASSSHSGSLTLVSPHSLSGVSKSQVSPSSVFSNGSGKRRPKSSTELEFTFSEDSSDSIDELAIKRQTNAKSKSESTMLEKVQTPAKRKSDSTRGGLGSSSKKPRTPASRKNEPVLIQPPAHLLWKWAGSPVIREEHLRPGLKRVHYSAIARDEEVLKIGDSAVFLTNGSPSSPYVGRLTHLYQVVKDGCNSSSSEPQDAAMAGGKVDMRVQCTWFYHPHETNRPKLLNPKGALFESSHADENDVQTISHKCDLLSYREYMKRLLQAKVGDDMDNVYYLAGHYFIEKGKSFTYEPGVKLTAPAHRKDWKEATPKHQTNWKPTTTKSDVKIPTPNTQSDLKVTKPKPQTDLKRSTADSQTDLKLAIGSPQMDMKVNKPKPQQDLKLSTANPKTDMTLITPKHEPDVKLPATKH